MLEPHSVDQVLRVLELTRQNKRLGFGTAEGCSRAIRQVAKESNVRYQTIGDGCRRRLGLTDMSEFHRLLEDWLRGDGSRLASTIKKNSSRVAHSRIDRFFDGSSSATAANGSVMSTPATARGANSKPLRITLNDVDARMLRVLAQLEDREPERLAVELLTGVTRDRLRAALG
jgi:hypothetical protein